MTFLENKSLADAIKIFLSKSFAVFKIGGFYIILEIKTFASLWHWKKKKKPKTKQNKKVIRLLTGIQCTSSK